MTTNPEQDILTLLTIPPPPTPPSPTTTSSHYSSHFQRIAHHLLFHHHLHLSTRRYTLLEVEFYARDASSCHLDPFTHGHPDQLRRGTWYFHRVGMSEGFKGGTRKGLDVTIGDEARAVRGGILIRAMREVDGARKVVEGPSLVCDRILEELGARTVKELVEETWEGKVEVWNREGGLWIEKVDGEEGCGCECAEEGGDAAAEKDEDKSSSAAQAANEAVDEAADNTATKASASTSTSTRKRSRSDITTTTTTTDPASFFIVKRLKPTGIPTTRRNPHPPLHTSSRVGLTLTNVTPTTRSRLEFVHKPYRYMQHPHLLRKGRQLLVLAMLSAGFPVRRVADVTGAGETAMEGWKRDMEEGKKKGRQVLKEFVGKKAAGEAKWAAKIFGAVRWWEMEMMERGVEEKF